MKIIGNEIVPGTTVQLEMEIARLHTQTKISVPVIVSQAKEPGPGLLIIGGIHGNELNGVEIVRKIVSLKLNRPDKGTIICIPVLNVFGFLNQQREFPDGRDLNRVFPGSVNGSLASRFAHFITTEIMPHVDYILDYHTGGEGRFNYSQLRIGEGDEETLELAKVFGVKFIKFAKNREKSFREIARKMGKKVLLFEGGKTLFLDKNVTNAGVQGAVNVMHHLGLRNASKDPLYYPNHENKIIVSASTWVRAKYSGMFRSNVRIGSFVKKGEILGSISDPFGYFERLVKAPNDGYILCRNHAAIVNQGGAIIHLTTEFVEYSA